MRRRHVPSRLVCNPIFIERFDHMKLPLRYFNCLFFLLFFYLLQHKVAECSSNKIKLFIFPFLRNVCIIHLEQYDSKPSMEL